MQDNAADSETGKLNEVCEVHSASFFLIRVTGEAAIFSVGV